MDQFQDNRADSSLIQCDGIRNQALGLLVGAAFDMVAPFFQDPLWQHPEMSNNRNSSGTDGLNTSQTLPATLDFDRIGSRLNQPRRVFHSRLRRRITRGWKVGHNPRPGRPPCDGPCVVEHVIHADTCGVRIA